MYGTILNSEPITWNLTYSIFSWPTSGGVSSTFTHVRASVRPCVCHQLTKLFIIFWHSLVTFLGCLYTSSKYLQISCMSVSPLVGLFTYRNQANLGISPVLDDLSSLIFLRHSRDISGLFTDHFKFRVCLSVCWLAYFLTEIRQL